jgi:hypothetical protein
LAWPPYKPGADPGDPDHEEDARNRWLKLGPGDVFLDLGAHAGSWSVPALVMGARVIAVDPDPRPLAELVAHATVSGLGDRLRAIAKSAGDTDADPSFRVDSLNLDRLDFVKVDVEGDELMALAGGLETLRRCRPKLMVEVHTKASRYRQVRVGEVTDLLDRAGLKYRYEPLDRHDNWYVHLYCEPIAE